MQACWQACDASYDRCVDSCPPDGPNIEHEFKCVDECGDEKDACYAPCPDQCPPKPEPSGRRRRAGSVPMEGKGPGIPAGPEPKKSANCHYRVKYDNEVKKECRDDQCGVQYFFQLSEITGEKECI